MKLPKRWTKYSRGGLIAPTKFVAFKTPLSQEIYPQLDSSQRFTPEDLIAMYPDIAVVIDLSFTNRFYDKRKEFEDKQIEHVKIKSTGHILPTNSQLRRFIRAVDDFASRYPAHCLIGVHCTHGINRTGYYICAYMIERLGFPPEVAINVFESGRGHAIERQIYVEKLLNVGGDEYVGLGEEERDERLNRQIVQW